MGFLTHLKEAAGLGIPMEDHMKFQGISLGESLNKFHDKLVTRGWVYDAETSKSLVGGKMYDGVFDGKKANLVVNYNVVTRTIEYAMVVFRVSTSDEAKAMTDEHIKKVRATYKMDCVRDAGGNYRFEMKNGVVVCGFADSFTPIILYGNQPNNSRYVEKEYSEF